MFKVAAWKLRVKIDQKRRSTWEGFLAPILNRFLLIFGAKLGPKIDKMSVQECIEKTMKKEDQQDGQQISPKTSKMRITTIGLSYFGPKSSSGGVRGVKTTKEPNADYLTTPLGLKARRIMEWPF